MGAWLAAAMAWCAGVAWQLAEPRLAPLSVYALGLLGAALLWAGGLAWGAWQHPGARLAWVPPQGKSLRWRPWVQPVVWAVALGLLAWASTGWRAHGLMQAPTWLPALSVGLQPGRLQKAEPVILSVRVDSLPVALDRGRRWRFDADVLDAEGGSAGRLRLYAAASDVPDLRPGQVWRVSVALRALDGTYNPGGWDPTRALFAQGVHAAGTVRPQPAPSLLVRAEAGVDAWRLRIRQAIAQQVPELANAGVLAGLSVGDQSAIDRDDWQIFQRTGVAHLVSISGTHVLMMGWLMAWVVRRLWSRSAWLCRYLPAPVAAAWAGVLAALLYALLSGWGIPAQRTVWMMAAVTVLRTMGVQWPWPLVWCWAGVVVLMMDPWAWQQASFWLSFVAVGTMMLMGGDAPPSGVKAAVRGLWATQWRATLVLAPVALMCFQSLSWVGLGANLLAIPWVSLVVVPLSLLGVVWAPLWSVAAWAVEVMRAVLELMATWPWAQGWWPLFPFWLGVWALLAAPVWLWRVPRPARWWAVPPLLALVCLPPSWQVLPPPPAGHWAVLAVDVEQGSAIVVQTARHRLLFDAGVRYPSGLDMGERAVVPSLRALGVTELNKLVVSHDDVDHHGGAPAVLAAMPVQGLTSSLPAEHPLRRHVDAAGRLPPHEPCMAGTGWVWDGVRFDWLHPGGDGTLAQATDDNARSCVLRVQALSGQGRAVLLTGDIGVAQERALIQRYGPKELASEVLLVPHHGSDTSSSQAFLQVVRPQEAVIQVGRRNRYGHPHPAVMQRLNQQGARVLATPSCGAYWRRSDKSSGQCWRHRQQPYWHADVLARRSP